MKEEQNKLEEALTTQKEGHNEFVKHINHELRNPLNQLLDSIYNVLQLTDRPQFERVMEALSLSLQRLTWRLDGITRYHDLHAEEWNAVEEEWTLEDWIDIQQATLNLTEKKDTVKVIFELDNKIQAERVRFCSSSMQVVFRHLVSNAVRFTENGQIKVKLSLDSTPADNRGQLSLTVTDTGIGFNSKITDLENLAFYQNDRSNLKVYQGMGLGLAIVNLTAKHMGGVFRIQSQELVGTAAQFQVSIGIVNYRTREQIEASNIEMAPFRSGKQVEPTQPPQSEDPAHNVLRILIVDDDEINVQMLNRICLDNNWHTDFAYNGKQALSRFAKNEFDVVLMDGAMPIVDGFEATSNIRDMEKDKKRSVIIATTGLTSRADHQRFMEAGADAFLAKPIFAHELVALIRLLTMR